MDAFLLRIIYQNDQVDVFKDIAFEPYSYLEDVHQTIVNSFGIEAQLDISFSLCDDHWKPTESHQLDESNDLKINDLIFKKGQRLLYQNGISEWIFEIELIDIIRFENSHESIVIVDEFGLIPETSPSEYFDPDRFLELHTKANYKSRISGDNDEDNEAEDLPNIEDYF